MLTMILIVFVAMASIVGLMAVGVVFGRKPIAGSCGGMSAIGMESECDVCGGDKSKCDKDAKAAKKDATDKKDLSYDAASK